MVDHRVGAFLVSAYIASDVKPTYDENRTKALFIAETRPSFWLPLVIRNAVDAHPDWNLYVAGTPDVIRFVQSAVGGDFRAIHIDVPSRISVNVYSAIMLSPELWDVFREETVLVFQIDTVIVRPVPATAPDLAILGAACGELGDDTHVANGGLSLRNVAAMRRAVRAMTPEEKQMPEDIAFCAALRRLGEPMPTITQCNEFAIESLGNPATVIGIHGTDKYYCPDPLVVATLAARGRPPRPVVDAFCYNGERRAVAARLKLLGDLVERIVIVEARVTHSGKRKHVLYKDRDADIFAPYESKIVWHIIDEFPEMPADWGTTRERAWPWIRGHHGQWFREAFQRDAIANVARSLDLTDPIVVVTDADEIPNPAAVADYADTDRPLHLDMDFLLYSPAWIKPERWTRGYIAPLNAFEIRTPTELRCEVPTDRVVPNGGWHCSFFFDADEIIRKTMSFAHQEHNTEQNTSPDVVRARIDAGHDPFGRGPAHDATPAPAEVSWLHAL